MALRPNGAKTKEQFYRPFLGKLIGKRNDIAHNGLIEENITTEDYNSILEETKKFLEEVGTTLKNYLLNEKYRKI